MNDPEDHGGNRPTMRADRPSRRYSFWLSLIFPLVVLGIVLANVDLAAVLRSLKGADPVLTLGAFLLLSLTPIGLLALRWQWALRRLYGIELSFRVVITEFWMALFAGYCMPAGFGSDVFRVIRLGRRSGGIPANAAVVAGEKAWTLLISGVLVLVAYPLVISKVSASPVVSRVIVTIAGLAALAVTALLLILIFKGPLKRRVRWALPRLLSPFFRWRNLAVGLGLTLAVQLIASCGGWLLLLALGVNLPLIVHVFVWALMNFVMFLPVTIAGLGLREASFILLFGFFGVSREAALAASLLALGCALVSIVPGAIFLAVHTVRGRPR